MAELPSKVHLTSHPIYLSMHGPLMYEDENERPWLHFVMDTGGDLQVRLCQMNLPSVDIELTTSPLISNTMPLMWTLHISSQYLDSMGRFWRIMHHVMEDDMEEMILELMDDS
ncbi:protein p13 MTCP-1-like [Myotis lucifugus]|uniref:protein p13 MTCP-1-like n=1 Tax=Myotis lucifugus TaxID=59463 RepID=UPI0003C440AA|nr:protein p13 MTCP-1-like [Myotis lucifugus]